MPQAGCGSGKSFDFSIAYSMTYDLAGEGRVGSNHENR